MWHVALLSIQVLDCIMTGFDLRVVALAIKAGVHIGADSVCILLYECARELQHSKKNKKTPRKRHLICYTKPGLH